MAQLNIRFSSTKIWVTVAIAMGLPYRFVRFLTWVSHLRTCCGVMASIFMEPKVDSMLFLYLALSSFQERLAISAHAMYSSHTSLIRGDFWRARRESVGETVK